MKVKYTVLIIFILNIAFNYAQEHTKDTIDNQVVNVVKPYTPTISDAFKIKDIPRLNDSSVINKKSIKYNIFSIPVASTFTPAKGKAASVDKTKAIKLYDNYASLSFGTYTTLLGEVYLNHSLSNSETVGGYFSHHSSQGGINDILLDDDFSKTNLNAYYAQKLRDLSWKISGGFDIQSYNWYGLPQNYFGEIEANNIDPGHTFTSFYVGGKLKFDDAIIKEGNVKFIRFVDDQDSGENRFMANTNFDVEIKDHAVNTNLFVDYLGGNFSKAFNTTTQLNYGNFIVGLAPSYQLKQDNITIDLGAKLIYFNDTELNESKFFVYPNIEASYRMVNEILIAYGGIKGSLIQNSYHNFANANPFVSPTLFINPTDRQYNGFIGLKGKLSNNVSYNIRGNYYSEKNKALFKTNDALSTAIENYEYGNSFGVVYDDVNTLSVAGELNIDVNRNFTLGIKGEYFNYDVGTQLEAWNLPDIKGSIFLDYQIAEKWFAGGSIYYVGKRKDQLLLTGPLITPNLATISLDSYFDANAHIGYKINDRLSIFAKANNIANQDYQRWLNFSVQGIQILAGITYQFDF